MAYYDSQKSGGWGFVVHDRDSRVRGSGAGKISHVTSAAQYEIIACEEAAKTAVEWGMTRVIIESDSTNLVRAMKSSEYDRHLKVSSIETCASSIFILLNFNSFEFSYSPRTCNKLAHTLAEYGASRQDKKLI
jgi:ribonuclease HI